MFMEKLVLKGKKEIRLILADSLHQTVQTLGLTKSKKKVDRLIDKSVRRIAELVADHVKKDSKKIKRVKEKKPKSPKAKKTKKVKKIKTPELESA
jgi:hypothetical protein